MVICRHELVTVVTISENPAKAEDWSAPNEGGGPLI